MPLFFILLLPWMIMSAIITAVLQRQHLLMTLLAFEGMILGLMSLYIFMSPSSDMFMSMVLLTMGACEASLGLACLVNMTRSYGNDHVSSLTLSKC
uniref:NADH dehydrogenase subunit 4L n=1 Tax=Chrysopetalum debile TaxID=115833 RepID=UPI001EDF02EC|nr:NADH dehydrogenase subunit 4L [Chrysopetalum debile]UJV31486.1 NADH dehydrogenase subunit 4L [Chrysopetalum debile]